jgi:hypothetical protein
MLKNEVKYVLQQLKVSRTDKRFDIDMKFRINWHLVPGWATMSLIATSGELAMKV